MKREDYGEYTFGPPCGHPTNGRYGQIPLAEINGEGIWVWKHCGLTIQMTGASPIAADNWGDANIALVTWPDGHLELHDVIDA